MEIGVVGLGSMGFAIANRLLEAGHNVTVWNRSKDKADALVKKGATLAHDPAGTASGDIVLSMLSDDDAVNKVVFGSKTEEESEAEGLFAHQSPETIHVSMSTISVELSKRLAEKSKKAGKKFIAAPVMGRPDVAERGELLVMAAGEKKVVEACKPAFEAFSKSVHVLGNEPQQAAIAKLSANFMLSCMIETFSEAFALLRKNDVDPEKFFDIIGPLFFQSPIYEKYGRIILKDKFDGGAFTLRLQEKDTRLAMNAAIQSKVPMPLLSVLENSFLTAIGRGYGDMDPCVLARVAAENAGLGKK